MPDILYFAYGSNMDKERMITRECTFKKVEYAYLEDYELVFDKKSLKMPGVTFANIRKKKGSKVEGMLYTVDESKIKFLDKFEGHPRHYLRSLFDVKLKDNSTVSANVYVAQKDWIVNEGMPTVEYMSHILAGKDYLSSDYFQELKKVKTMKEEESIKESIQSNVVLSNVLSYDDFLLERANYYKHYSTKDIANHLKKFKEITISYEDITKKMQNLYNYTANFLHTKYPGYDIEKSTEEGPADEEYMKLLDKILSQMKK